jgi:hypothetical protein
MKRLIGFLVLGGAVAALLVRRLVQQRRVAPAGGPDDLDELVGRPQARGFASPSSVHGRSREELERAHAELRARLDRIPIPRKDIP